MTASPDAPPPNVVGLFGNIPQGQPYLDLIEMLEKLLSLAKSGELRGAAIAFVTDHGGNLLVDDDWAAAAGARWALAAAVMRLHSIMASNIADGDG